MANLIRIKQIDQPELSGYVVSVTDQSYYPVGNPSGYLSSVASDPDFISLSGDLGNTGVILDSKITSLSGTSANLVVATGAFLQGQITSLSGDLNVTNANLSTVSGLSQSAITLVTGLDYEVSGVISGEVAGLNATITGTSGVLFSQISTVSGNLNSRVTSLETSLAASGSNFLDLASNNQTVSGTKVFTNRIGFKQIDLLPFSGNYSNPGGQHEILFTQFTEDYSFAASGYGTLTGDLFVTKIMHPNNVELIISSMIYTGNY
jgi:hypothetical protein